MSTDIRSRGRPRGSKRATLSGWMSQHQSFTMGQLSKSLGWPLDHANKTLRRAVQAGEVRVCGTTRTPEAKRPIALYEPADRPVASIPLANLLRVWS